MAGFGKKKEKTERIKLNKGAFKKSLQIFEFFKDQRAVFAIGFIFLILSSITSLVFPKFMGDLINASNQPDYLSQIKRVATILLAIFAAQAVFSYFRI